MNRPSHWIFAFLLVSGIGLWLAGGPENLVEERRSGTPRVTVALNHRPAPAYAELRGQVVDRLGWPVENAEVRLLGSDDEAVLTDAEGRFDLEVAGAVHRRLRITAPGRFAATELRGSLDQMAIVLQDELPWAEDVAIADDAAPTLLAGEGFVEDIAGDAVAGARVQVLETGAMAQADDTGRFVVSLPADEFRLVAWNEAGHAALAEPMDPTRPQGKMPVPNLILTDAATLRGRLVDANGAPLEAITLILDGDSGRRTAHSAGDGSFVFQGLLPGLCSLTGIPHQGLLGFREPVEITAASEAGLNLGDIVVVRQPEEPLRIRVAHELRDSAPLTEVYVVAEQLGGLRRAVGVTDQNGEVALIGLVRGELTEFEVGTREDGKFEIAGFDGSVLRIR